MIEYKVMISEVADADLEEIVDYIAVNLQEPVTALNQMGRIKDAMMSLRTMPERHGVVSVSYTHLRKESKTINQINPDVWKGWKHEQQHSLPLEARHPHARLSPISLVSGIFGYLQ